MIITSEDRPIYNIMGLTEEHIQALRCSLVESLNGIAPHIRQCDREILYTICVARNDSTQEALKISGWNPKGYIEPF